MAGGGPVRVQGRVGGGASGASAVMHWQETFLISSFFYSDSKFLRNKSILLITFILSKSHHCSD